MSLLVVRKKGGGWGWMGYKKNYQL